MTETHLCAVCGTKENVGFFEAGTETRAGISVPGTSEVTAGDIPLPDGCAPGYFCHACVEELYSRWWENDLDSFLAGKKH